jgi:hypothetical protein
VIARRGCRSLSSICWGTVEPPQISLCASFKPHLLFSAGTHRLCPNDPELCFVLSILQHDHTADFELATDRTQSNAGPADVERVNKLRIGIAGSVVTRDSYRQNRLGPVHTALFTHSCLLYQSRQSFIWRSQCHVLKLCEWLNIQMSELLGE